eukprot:TRINITY_DN5871_c0_g1_i5.p1 TRINITY_DN5871_c0_g1~~TRINITY_DN5871_c0_g1_i5.p1  ORF type:complete len:526 (-),score=71.09 TRINITY_DN5871_c0_g1_i5:320-1837(-)
MTITDHKDTLSEYLANPECRLAGLEHITEYLVSKSSDKVPYYHCNLEPCCNEQGKARQMFKHLNSYCHRKAWLAKVYNLEYSTRSEIDAWFQNNQFEMAQVNTIVDERLWEYCKLAMIRGGAVHIDTEVLGQANKAPVKPKSSIPRKKGAIPKKKPNSNIHTQPKKLSQNASVKSKVSNQNKPKDAQNVTKTQDNITPNIIVPSPSMNSANILTNPPSEQSRDTVVCSLPPVSNIPVLQDVSNANIANNITEKVDTIESVHNSINIDLLSLHEQSNHNKTTAKISTTANESESQQNIAIEVKKELPQQKPPPPQPKQRQMNRSESMIADKPEVNQETSATEEISVKNEGPRDLLHPEADEVQLEGETETSPKMKDYEHPETTYRKKFSRVVHKILLKGYYECADVESRKIFNNQEYTEILQYLSRTLRENIRQSWISFNCVEDTQTPGEIIVPDLSEDEIRNNYGIEMEIGMFFESEKYPEIMKTVQKRMEEQREKERALEMLKM